MSDAISQGGLPRADGPLPEAEAVARYRAMTPADKISRVVDLNRVVDDLAAARLRVTYGKAISPRELELRLAALRLDRDTMIHVFHWDPDIEGY